MKRSRLFLISCLSLWYSCQSSDLSTENETTETIEEELAPAEPENFKIKDPCDLISSEKMIQFTSLDSSQKMGVESKVLTYPTCVYRWENVLVKTKTFELGEELELELPAQVNIVLLREKNAEDYQRAIKTYVDPQEIEGVGEMAVWGDRLSQLTFLAQDHIFHVYVNVNNAIEINRQVAEEIAREIFLSL